MSAYCLLYLTHLHPLAIYKKQLCKNCSIEKSSCKCSCGFSGTRWQTNHEMVHSTVFNFIKFTYYNTGTCSDSLAHNLIVAFHQKVHILATKRYQFSLYGGRKYYILGTTIYPPFTRNKKQPKILSKKHVNKFQIFVKYSTFMK